MEMILRSEVLKEIATGEPFDELVFVTCDRRRGTGGKLIRVRHWKKLDTVDEARKLTTGRRKVAINMLKNPNHWENKTFNIFNPLNRSLHPYRVHFRLIQLFNGKRVVNG